MREQGGNREGARQRELEHARGSTLPSVDVPAPQRGQRARGNPSERPRQRAAQRARRTRRPRARADIRTERVHHIKGYT
eukprot:7800733-Pyramimonas_sp.AAC.1